MSAVIIENVSKSFEHSSTRVDVLQGLSATIADGERVAIVGPSGSGKSTLLSLMAGLDVPTSGRVIIDGKDLGSMSEAGLSDFRSRSLSIVFQRFHLMSALSAVENVELPLEIRGDKHARERASAALAAVGLAHRESHFPRELSGGESQRVAIARALVAEPRVLLADEPSGNLDNQTGDAVMDLLFDLVSSRKTTLVLVTHNPELAKRCDRILTLRQGAFVS